MPPTDTDFSHPSTLQKIKYPNHTRTNAPNANTVSERWSNYQSSTLPPITDLPQMGPFGPRIEPFLSKDPNGVDIPAQLTTSHQHTSTGNICIFQLNLNKYVHTHLELMNNRLSTLYKLILIQEPHTNTFNNIRTPTNFRAVYPSHRLQSDDPIRSVIWVNNSIDTSNWIALDIPNTNNISAIQLTNNTGTISIFNIYNDCLHSHNEHSLNSYINNNRHKILATENHHMI